ncbi:MAG: TonB family protein, partial [Bacteroidales bacterium]
MTTKKSIRADLEKKKNIFLSIGIIIAMTAVLFAFNWKQYDRNNYNIDGITVVNYDQDDIPIIVQKKTPPPKASQEIKISDDPEEEFKDIDLPDPEATAETYVPGWDFSGYDFDPPVDTNEVFDFPQIEPSFPGGNEAMAKYLRKKLRVPERAKASRISGTVFISFIVEKDGSISNVEVIKGIGGGCDQEAARVVASMPKWNPGM